MDPKFRYRVAFVPKVSGKASKAVLAVEFIKPGSPEATAVERILLKEVERPKYLSSEIVTKANAAGYTAFKFNMYDHTLLSRQLDARKPGKGYGVMVAKSWYWLITGSKYRNVGRRLDASLTFSPLLPAA